MDPTIVAAIIGAVATIAAAIIALIALRRGSKRSAVESSSIQSGVVKKIKDIITNNTNTIHVVETPIDLVVSRLTIENFPIPPPLVAAADVLIFITERAIAFRADSDTGFAVSFTLRNRHQTTIVIYSIRLELVSFLDERSREFKTVKGALADRTGFIHLSAPITVYGGLARLNAQRKTCEVIWGGWDDSTGSRGIAFDENNLIAYRKMLETIANIDKAASNIENTDFELLPPSVRFEQQPGDTDSFHFEFFGEAEGVYIIQFKVGYHIDCERADIASDQTYVFASVDLSKGGLSMQNVLFPKRKKKTPAISKKAKKGIST